MIDKIPPSPPAESFDSMHADDSPSPFIERHDSDSLRHITTNCGPT